MSAEKITLYLKSVNKLLRCLIISICVALILKLVIIMCLRAGYPYSITWYEDENLNQVQRIKLGMPLYDEPKIDYIAQIYGPTYNYATFLISWISGFNLFSLRIISILSTCLTIFYIYLFVYKETKNHFSGFTSAALYSATYPFTRYNFDVGRVDALFVLLLIVSFYLIRFSRSFKANILTALFLLLASLTKTGALVMVFVYSVYFTVKFELRRRGFILILVFIILGIYYFNHMSRGWYYHYAFDSVYHHRLNYSYMFAFWIEDLIFRMPLIFIGQVFIMLYLLKKKINRKGTFFCGLVSMLFISCYSRIKEGGDLNVLMPAYAVLSILFGFFTDFIFKYEERYKNWHRIFFVSYVLMILLVQMFILMLYRLPLPKKEDFDNAKYLYKLVNSFDGDVYMSNHRDMIDFRKGRYAHLHALNDIQGLYGDKIIDREGVEIVRELKDRFSNKFFSAVILDEDSALQKHKNYFYTEINHNYLINEKVFFPIEERAYFIYLPKKHN